MDDPARFRRRDARAWREEDLLPSPEPPRRPPRPVSLSVLPSSNKFINLTDETTTVCFVPVVCHLISILESCDNEDKSLTLTFLVVPPPSSLSSLLFNNAITFVSTIVTRCSVFPCVTHAKIGLFFVFLPIVLSFFPSFCFSSTCMLFVVVRFLPVVDIVYCFQFTVYSFFIFKQKLVLIFID